MRRDVPEHRQEGGDGFPSSISIEVVGPAGDKLPVLGWRECMTRHPIEVWRQPDESDDALHDRAEQAMKARPGRDPRSVPVMVAITEVHGNGP